MQEDKLPRALGWFSIGLGLAELLATRRLGRFLGVSQSTALIRLCGLREIATGLGLLSAGRKGPWLWARVVGDALDLALLGAAFRSRTARPGPLAFAIGSVAAVSALDAAEGRKFGANGSSVRHAFGTL